MPGSPAPLDVRIQGAALVLPRAGVFSGRTAVHLRGARELVDETRPGEVTVPPEARFGPVTGIRVRQARLGRDEVVSRRGHRCTSGLRTAPDVARLEPLAEAVVVLDVLLDRCTVGESALRAPDGPGRTPAPAGGGPGRRAGRVPAGVLAAVLAGLTPVPQWSVCRSDGVFLVGVGLAWPQQRLAVEYDGAWHGRPGELARDRRLDGLVAAGWRVLHVTAADLRSPEALIARARALLSVEIGGAGR